MAGLTIRFASDVEPAKRAMADLAGSVAANAVRMGLSIRDTVVTINRLTAATSLLVGSASSLAVLAGAYILVKTAIDQGVESIDRFVEIGRKAAGLGVGTTFFQAWTGQAHQLKIEIDSLEQSLRNAANAVRPVFEDTAGIRKRLGEFFESGYLGDYESRGLRQFDQATTPEARIRAVIVALDELDRKVGRLATIDIAEQLFGSGSDLAEKIRAGALSFDQILNSLDAASKKKIVAEEDIRQAQALRDRLDEAYRKLDAALAASISLAREGRAIYEAWIGIVEATAGAAENAATFVDKIMQAAPAIQSLRQMQIDTLRQQQSNLQRQLEFDRRLPGTNPTQLRGREAELQEVNRRLLALETGGASEYYDGPPSAGIGTGGPPLPPRRPLSAYLNPPPPPPPGGGGGGGGASSTDGIERYLASLQRANELLQAEAENLGKSNVEMAKATALAQLNAEAKRAGREPTETEIANTLKLAEANQALRDRIEEVQKAQREAAEAARFFGQMAADSLADAILEGKGFLDILRDIERQILRAVLNSALTGSGPLAGLFGTAPSAAGGVGGIAGFVTSLFPKAHTGGIVGSGSLAQVRLPVMAFAGAPRFHGGGVVGADEVPILARRGEGVFTPEQMRALGAGMQAPGRESASPRSMVVQFHVTAPAPDAFLRSEAQITRMLGRAVRRGARGM